MKKQKESLGILERVKTDDNLGKIWAKLSPKSKQIIIEIDERQRVPDILNDAMFKGVFDPDRRPEWISRRESAVH